MNQHSGSPKILNITFPNSFVTFPIYSENLHNPLIVYAESLGQFNASRI